MTTLCIDDLPSGVARLNPRPDAIERAKIAAGSAAFARALALGYCRTSARALQRTARRELLPGETAEACAKRIVPQAADHVMVPRRPLPPKGAA